MKAQKPQRPRSGPEQRIGDERHALIRDAFTRAQGAIRAGYYIEAISIVESIAADRLGSLLHGIVRQRVELDATIGNLIHGWENPSQAGYGCGAKRKPPIVAVTITKAVPPDIALFLKTDLRTWTKGRNKAVHSMAKLHRKGDLSFAERYAELEAIALEGVRVLRRLDELDCREKALNGKRAATEPGALDIDDDLHGRIFDSNAPTS